jgi:putative nucleotidyltransferase with HDIG domain
VENGSYEPLLGSIKSPELDVARDGCERTTGDEQTQESRPHSASPYSGTNGSAELITQKGEIQVVLGITFAKIFGSPGRPTRRDRALGVYAAGLLTAVTGLIVVSLEVGHTWGSAWAVPALALSALLAERQGVRLSPRAEVSVSFLPIVLAAVLYGPLAAIAVSATSLLLDFEAPYLRWLVWTTSRSLAAGAAGWIAIATGAHSMHSLTDVVYVVVAATLAEQLGDLFLNAGTAYIRGMPLREVAREASTILVTIPLYTPLTAILVYAYREVSPWSVAFFLVPAFAAQKLFLLYQEQRATAEQLQAAIQKQEKANLSFATALVTGLDARDRYTAGHSAAVAIYARDIAERLGLSEEKQRLAHMCGLVHDIGKIVLPPGLLEKPGPLSLDERRQMETHPAIGERILTEVEDYSEIAAVVRHHHERFDGAGYPDGLLGEDIPLLSRIIGVADAYDAMTSDRPYRDAMPSRVARLRLAQAVETQFDTTVVAAFEAILASASENYRLGAGSDFSFTSQEDRSRVPSLSIAVASLG